MKKVIANKWIKALRSDEYNQGIEQLCKETEGGDYFCCLGILAELYCKETGAVWKSTNGNLTIHDSLVYIPIQVSDWAGMASFTGAYKKRSRVLTDDNDGEGNKRKSFKQIANIIENIGKSFRKLYLPCLVIYNS